mgnify:CR=1 FL=1
MGFVRDRDVESPLIVFVHEFRNTDSPRVGVQRVLHSFEVSGTTTKDAFDVVVRFVTDAEANVTRVVHSERVSFVVVHPHRIRFIDVRGWASPVVVFVVVVRLNLFECFLDEELGSVFDVVGVINYGVVDVVPVPAFTIKSVDFVTYSPGFETAVVQVVRTPRLDGQSKRKCLGESCILHYQYFAVKSSKCSVLSAFTHGSGDPWYSALTAYRISLSRLAGLRTERQRNY